MLSSLDIVWVYHLGPHSIISGRISVWVQWKASICECPDFKHFYMNLIPHLMHQPEMKQKE